MTFHYLIRLGVLMIDIYLFVLTRIFATPNLAQANYQYAIVIK